MIAEKLIPFIGKRCIWQDLEFGMCGYNPLTQRVLRVAFTHYAELIQGTSQSYQLERIEDNLAVVPLPSHASSTKIIKFLQQKYPDFIWTSQDLENEQEGIYKR